VVAGDGRPATSPGYRVAAKEEAMASEPAALRGGSAAALRGAPAEALRGGSAVAVHWGPAAVVVCGREVDALLGWEGDDALVQIMMPEEHGEEDNVAGSTM
jgi:hypothetical protein